MTVGPHQREFPVDRRMSPTFVGFVGADSRLASQPKPHFRAANAVFVGFEWVRSAISHPSCGTRLD